MNVFLAIALLVLMAITLVGAGLSVSRIGDPPTDFQGGRAGFIITYCIVEIAVLSLSARELLVDWIR